MIRYMNFCVGYVFEGNEASFGEVLGEVFRLKMGWKMFGFWGL